MSDLVLCILLVNIEPVKEAIVVLRRWPRCYNACLTSRGTWGGTLHTYIKPENGGWVPGAHWPVSLAEWVDFRVSQRPCLKDK